MKFTTIIAAILAYHFSSGQVCNVDFSYTIGNNNVVSTSDHSTNSCLGWSGCCLSFDFGDPNSGRLNTLGSGHFYKYPGTYTICETLSYSGIGGCSCIDSACKQVTIVDTGSNCNSKFCYTATDTNGFLKVTFFNTSYADDSIASFTWDFNDGLISVATNPTHIFDTTFSSYQLTYLFIRTQNGCESVFYDTLRIGTNCDSLQTSFGDSRLSSAKDVIKIYPTIIQASATVETAIFGKDVSLGIIDLSGKLIKHVPLNEQKNNFTRGDIGSGTYIYKLFSKGTTIATGKLLFY